MPFKRYNFLKYGYYDERFAHISIERIKREHGPQKDLKLIVSGSSGHRFLLKGTYLNKNLVEARS